MRYSELASKELVNTVDGKRLGMLGNSDLVINERTGKIISVVIERRSVFKRSGEEIVIPWTSVKKVGEDVIILELNRRTLIE